MNINDTFVFVVYFDLQLLDYIVVAVNREIYLIVQLLVTKVAPLG